MVVALRQQIQSNLKYYEQTRSYSTYHYWRKKCSVDKNSAKQELAPISFKQAATESSLEGQAPHGVALLFPNGLRAHFGNGFEEMLMELLTKSLGGGHV